MVATVITLGRMRFTAEVRANGVAGKSFELVLNLLAAFQALGTLMGVGLMMLPAIAARHWAREVGLMAYAAAGIAIVSTVIGLLLSFHLDLPSGPSIVLVAGLAWACSVLLGPVDGLLPRLVHRRHLAG